MSLKLPLASSLRHSGTGEPICVSLGESVESPRATAVQLKLEKTGFMSGLAHPVSLIHPAHWRPS